MAAISRFFLRMSCLSLLGCGYALRSYRVGWFQRHFTRSLSAVNGRTAASKEKCILVGVDRGQSERGSAESLTFRESLEEMTELCDTAGLSVVAICGQNMQRPNPKSYLGGGKLAELEAMCRNYGAATIVVDDELTPRQQKALESIANPELEAANLKVLDRTAVILDIFAQHAQSREGKLQVELAMAQYRQTRGPNVVANINGNSDNTGRGSGGGAGMRGPGETKVELDRRRLAARIEVLEKEIKQLQNQRLIQRKGRSRMGAPMVALVGYTNAGKSTVLNRLTNAGVLAENMLFATLDPTTRKVRLPSTLRTTTAPTAATSNDQQAPAGMEILLTDTVGFISKLPSHIVAAFRATLESLADADVLVHVIDRSNPAWEKQRAVVNAELARIAKESGRAAPLIQFWNKLDNFSSEEAAAVIAAAKALPIEMEVSHDPSVDEHLLPEGDSVRMHPAAESETEDPEIQSISCLPDDPPVSQITNNDTHKVGKKGKSKNQRRNTLVVPESLPELARAADTAAVTVKPGASVRAVPVDRMVLTAVGSARAPDGMSDLFEKLEAVITRDYVTVECFFPYAEDAGTSAMVMSRGAVVDVEYRDEGVYLKCKLPPSVVESLESSGFLLPEHGDASARVDVLQ